MVTAERRPLPPDAAHLPDFLLPVEVAGVLRCSRAHIYRLIERSELPFVKAGGRVLVPRDALLAYLARATRMPGA